MRLTILALAGAFSLKDVHVSIWNFYLPTFLSSIVHLLNLEQDADVC